MNPESLYILGPNQWPAGPKSMASQLTLSSPETCFCIVASS